MFFCYFYRIFGIKCSRCGDRVQPNDMVMRAQNNIFHLPCFVCWICCQPLQKGEQFILRGGQVFCRHDFEKDIYLSQHCVDDDLMMDDVVRPRDGRRGPKRPRTILTSAQRRQFKASFEMSPKPCRKVREALAKDTGLSVRVVQVWFQNQRAKMKKIQRKAKQDGGDKNSDKDSCKDEKGIKQESPNSEHDHYLGLDGSYSSQPLNPNMPYSPDGKLILFGICIFTSNLFFLFADYLGNSNDSFCSSDISLDGSNFDQMDDATSDTIMSLQNDMHTSSSHRHSNHENSISSHTNINSVAGSNINPIDKLYLMQNSYFNSEH